MLDESNGCRQWSLTAAESVRWKVYGGETVRCQCRERKETKEQKRKIQEQPHLRVPWLTARSHSRTPTAGQWSPFSRYAESISSACSLQTCKGRQQSFYRKASPEGVIRDELCRTQNSGHKGRHWKTGSLKLSTPVHPGRVETQDTEICAPYIWQRIHSQHAIELLNSTGKGQTIQLLGKMLDKNFIFSKRISK